MANGLMFDSVDVKTIPEKPMPYAVAGYVGGWWPTYSPLVAKFPLSHHLSIAVNASEQADCLDIENGDAVPAQAPGWVAAAIHRGVDRPVLYVNLSNISAVIDQMNRAGFNRSQYRLWVAHYVYDQTKAFAEMVGSHYDAEQFNDHYLARNLDASVVSSSFFAAQNPTVQHHNLPHYERFQQGPFELDGGLVVSELATVQAYDRHRRHPLLQSHQLAKFQDRCGELAGRIYSVALAQPREDGRPSWNLYWRGWRFQQLIHRAQGARLV